MKVVTIVGARPQFIKASLVSKALKEFGFEEVIVHTGQHYDSNMSDLFFVEMQIARPKYNLDINGLTHGAMTGRMLEEIEKVLVIEKPDWVIVFGDTDSTLAGALAAKKLHIKVAHIEAGLRSFNNLMPEEINRVLTDRLSDILFCPTKVAITNLLNEGYSGLNCKIEEVGDVMYDTYLTFKKMAKKPVLNLKHDKFIVATIHRAENTDNINNLHNIINLLNELSFEYDVVFPVHPRTREIIHKNAIPLDFSPVDPLGYLEMIWLLDNSEFVVTDSGGLQKEAYFARKKCITLRSETEWVELVERGWNQLLDPQKTIKVSDINLVIPKTYNLFYGDGNTSQKIAMLLM